LPFYQALRYRDFRRWPSRKHRARFGKVDEDLHRYSSNKAYYAVFGSQGKLIWKSLGTDARELARRVR